MDVCLTFDPALIVLDLRPSTMVEELSVSKLLNSAAIFVRSLSVLLLDISPRFVVHADQHWTGDSSYDRERTLRLCGPAVP
jgi:hypothetical protein